MLQFDTTQLQLADMTIDPSADSFETKTDGTEHPEAVQGGNDEPGHIESGTKNLATATHTIAEIAETPRNSTDEPKMNQESNQASEAPQANDELAPFDRGSEDVEMTTQTGSEAVETTEASETLQAGDELAPVDRGTEKAEMTTRTGPEVVETAQSVTDEHKMAQDSSEGLETFQGKPLKQLFPEEREGWRG